MVTMENNPLDLLFSSESEGEVHLVRVENEGIITTCGVKRKEHGAIHQLYQQFESSWWNQWVHILQQQSILALVVVDGRGNCVLMEPMCLKGTCLLTDSSDSLGNWVGQATEVEGILCGGRWMRGNWSGWDDNWDWTSTAEEASC